MRKETSIMADLAEVEARIRLLEEECRELRKLRDIEAIKQVKYRYFRCLDSKRWDEMKECFAEDAETDWASGKWQFQGVDAIVQFLSKTLPYNRITMHQGHHPEIELTSDTTARGKWSLQDYIIDNKGNLYLMGASFYNDEYVKVNGDWKIKVAGYERIFEEIGNQSDNPSLKLTENRFASYGDPGESSPT